MTIVLRVAPIQGPVHPKCRDGRRGLVSERKCAEVENDTVGTINIVAEAGTIAGAPHRPAHQWASEKRAQGILWNYRQHRGCLC
jgi:hypothetical protein